MRFPSLSWFVSLFTKHRSDESHSGWSIGRWWNPERTVRVPAPLSEHSTLGIYDGIWCSPNMILGAGMVVIQQKTHKIVVIYDEEKKTWFFPRGRKDIGESLETAALREAREESRYDVQFMRLLTGTRQPPPPSPPSDTSVDKRPKDRKELLNAEPVAVSLMEWKPSTARKSKEEAQYLTTWYVGQISEDAVESSERRQLNETRYQTKLYDFNEALTLLGEKERQILQYVWARYELMMEGQVPLVVGVGAELEP